MLFALPLVLGTLATGTVAIAIHAAVKEPRDAAGAQQRSAITIQEAQRELDALGEEHARRRAEAVCRALRSPRLHPDVRATLEALVK